MPTGLRKGIYACGALALTLIVFGFFFLVVSQLPQPKPQVVTVDILPSTKP